MLTLQYGTAVDILRISAFDDFKSMSNVRVTSTSPDAESATYLLGGGILALQIIVLLPIYNIMKITKSQKSNMSRNRC